MAGANGPVGQCRMRVLRCLLRCMLRESHRACESSPAAAIAEGTAFTAGPAGPFWGTGLHSGTLFQLVTCPSGRRCNTRNVVWCKSQRGFKSHRHRQRKPLVSQGFSASPDGLWCIGDADFVGGLAHQPSWHRARSGGRRCGRSRRPPRRSAAGPTGYLCRPGQGHVQRGSGSSKLHDNQHDAR